jgi:putative transposase
MKSKIRLKDDLNKELKSYLANESQTAIEDFLTGACRQAIQLVLEEEVSDFLGRQRYVRRDKKQEEFRGYRNGYQDCQIKTRSGRLDIKKPRVRENNEPYDSRIMERLEALEDNLKKIVLESYVRGLSTRDIEATFQDDKGKPLLSRTSVSNIARSLNQEYEEFSRKDLSGYDVVYLFVDAVYEAVKRYTNNQALLCAWAITSAGEKVMLALNAVTSESEAAWSTFFEEMIDRGLPQPLLIISDGSKGLINAISRSFPQSDRQRCIAHKLRNIMVKVPEEYHNEILINVKSIYYAPDYETAKVLGGAFINKYSEKFPSAVNCFLDDLEACLMHLKYPSSHHRYIRTTNLIERAFEEEKRRTKIFPQHQNEKGALGLVFSVLIRASQKWRWIKMTTFELTVLKNIKKIKCPNENDLLRISFKRAA